MTEPAANAVFDILVQYAGAPRLWRGSFVADMGAGADVLRFGGDRLGWGARLHIGADAWRVTYYDVEQSAERDVVKDTANAALAVLRAKMMEEGTA